MSEYYYATISIPKGYITGEVLEAIVDEFNSVTPEDDANGVYLYSDQSATNGWFESLESLLVNKRVPFDRYTSGYVGQPAYRYYRPETDSESSVDITILTDYDGSNYVTTDKLREILALGEDKIFEALKKAIEEVDPKIKPLSEYCSVEQEECDMEIYSYEVDMIDIHDGSDTIHVYLKLKVSDALHKEWSAGRDLYIEDWRITVTYDKKTDNYTSEFTNNGIYLDLYLSDDDVKTVEEYLMKYGIIDIIKKNCEQGIGISLEEAINLTSTYNRFESSLKSRKIYNLCKRR